MNPGKVGVVKHIKAVAKSEKSGIIDSQEMYIKGYAYRRKSIKIRMSKLR